MLTAIVKPDWDIISASIVRIENLLCHGSGVIVGPHLVMTALHGSGNIGDEFEVIMSDGSKKIAAIEVITFTPLVEDMAILRLRCDQSSFVRHLKVLRKMPEVMDDIFVLSMKSQLNGDYNCTFQKTSIFGFESRTKLFTALYYAEDGFSGSGAVTEVMPNGEVLVVGVHVALSDATVEPPPIKKNKNGTLDSDSVSRNSEGHSKNIHGHIPYGLVCIASMVVDVMAIIDNDII